MSRLISTFKGKTLDMFIHGFFQFRYQLSRIFFSCRYQQKQKKISTVDICKQHHIPVFFFTNIDKYAKLIQL